MDNKKHISWWLFVIVMTRWEPTYAVSVCLSTQQNYMGLTKHLALENAAVFMISMFMDIIFATAIFHSHLQFAHLLNTE